MANLEDTFINIFGQTFCWPSVM